MRAVVDPYGHGVLIEVRGHLAALTRDDAERLRDEITTALNDHTGETPAERAHRELHDGSRTAMPPEGLS